MFRIHTNILTQKRHHLKKANQLLIAMCFFIAFLPHLVYKYKNKVS